MRMRQHILIAATAATLLATGCANMNDTQRRTATGAGVGAVAGAVIGAFILGVMNNGMSIMGINIDLQQMIKGVVLLAAVFFDLYNKNRA